MLGSTVIKEDEHGINAFAPVEKHALMGRVSHQVELYDIAAHVYKRPFTLMTGYDVSIAYFECISAIDIKQFENYIENPEVAGVLVGGYDEGNMPTQMKYYIATAVNSYNKPICFISNTDNGIAVPTQDGRIGEFVRAGAIALGDMIKESAFQKMCFVMGVANQQKDLEGREKIEFVRKLMHTNLTGEISDRYCEMGDKVYKGIFSSRTFSAEDVNKAIDGANELADLGKRKKAESALKKGAGAKKSADLEVKPVKPEPKDYIEALAMEKEEIDAKASEDEKGE